MRICDDRYSRDRLRLDLALRFIGHEARTQTIRAWTGLSDDRIRKLCRAYAEQPDHGALSRHRGKSPRQCGFFTRSQRMRQETALLASLCCLLGVLPLKALPESGWSRAGVACGERLCQAFEAYRFLLARPHISFEHTVFLVTALTRGDELTLAGCAECGSLVVTEACMLRAPRCTWCAAGKPSPSTCKVGHQPC